MLSSYLLFLALTTMVLAARKHKKPNIVLVLTDDQDLHLGSVDYMPLLKRHIIDHGTFYKQHYCSTAICCLSRVTCVFTSYDLIFYRDLISSTDVLRSVWTGRNAHNTNVTDVFPPYGGCPKFVSQGLNEDWLPLWLQDAGYSTYYTGKLFNHHTVENWDSPKPSGWTSSDFLLDPHTYEYLNATFQRNDQPPASYEGRYSTDVIAEKAYGFLEEGVKSKKPFFLTIAPIAPHSNCNLNDFLLAKDDTPLDKVVMTAPIPAERHKHLFPGVKIPRNANFNPDKPGGASWVRHLAKLTNKVIEYNDEFYRARLQALQAVDEIVDGIVTRLTDHGMRVEEDINIPLIIRGPGVPTGEGNIVTAHTDIAPTLRKLAGGTWGWENLDGSPIPLDEEALREAKETRQEHVNVEFWGVSIPEGVHKFSLDDGKTISYGKNNTYKALRFIGKDYNLYYSVWCTNEHELYDLTTDPHQINNIHPLSSRSPTDHKILGIPLSKVLPRLDALLMVTKSCKGATCINPWSVIHPKGNVNNLGDALSGAFDQFYSSVSQKVGFIKCELGYILESEGPQEAVVFDEAFESHFENEEL